MEMGRDERGRGGLNMGITTRGESWHFRREHKAWQAPHSPVIGLIGTETTHCVQTFLVCKFRLQSLQGRVSGGSFCLKTETASRTPSALLFNFHAANQSKLKGGKSKNTNNSAKALKDRVTLPAASIEPGKKTGVIAVQCGGGLKSKPILHFLYKQNSIMIVQLYELKQYRF